MLHVFANDLNVPRFRMGRRKRSAVWKAVALSTAAIPFQSRVNADGMTTEICGLLLKNMSSYGVKPSLAIVVLTQPEVT